MEYIPNSDVRKETKRGVGSCLKFLTRTNMLLKACSVVGKQKPGPVVGMGIGGSKFDSKRKEPNGELLEGV